MMRAQNDDSTILEQNDWIIRVNRFFQIVNYFTFDSKLRVNLRVNLRMN